MSDLQQLIEFGFNEIRAKKALKATKNGGIQPALDWLEQHQNDDDIDVEPMEETEEQSNEPEPNRDDGEIKDGEQNANSLKCDDCGKLLRDSAAAEMHAMKTEHQSFSESTEAIKPLTAEEKAARLADLKQKLAEKRAVKAKEEEAAQRQNELIRRKAGQELQQAKEDRKMKEALKAAEEAARDKKMEKEAKERVRRQIEQDKKDRAARAEKERLERAGLSVPEPVVVTPRASVAAAPSSDKSYTDARIQIRPAEGTPITHTFQATSLLKEVYSHASSELDLAAGTFKLATTFPRKVFGDGDLSKSLKELGLVPSAALMVVR